MANQLDFENERGKCCICGGPYVRYGNNPAPLVNDGRRCCEDCNNTLVIPERLRKIARDNERDNSRGGLTINLTFKKNWTGSKIKNSVNIHCPEMKCDFYVQRSELVDALSKLIMEWETL